MMKLLIKCTMFWAVLAILAACTPNRKELPGRWQAVAFFEKGKSVNTPLDSVALSLQPDGSYEFSSQGFYHEKGDFRMSSGYLYLNDTTVSPAKEHVLKILYLSKDSLKIRMSRDQTEQVLFFTRRK